MFRKGIISILIVFLILAMSSTCFAQQAERQPNALNKLSNGAVNLLTGWVEIPRNIGERFTKKDMGSILTEGILKGVVDAITRTAAGALDVVTFLFPPYDKPAMEPYDYLGQKK